MVKSSNAELVKSLVEKHGYKEWVKGLKRAHAVELIHYDLLYAEVGEMNANQLMTVLKRFSFSEVPATQKELFTHVHYANDVMDTVKELVASCLTYAILGAMEPKN